MILTEDKLRHIIREALEEAIKDHGVRAAKGLGAEYLYALLQPALIDTGNLDLAKIELPVHHPQEDVVEYEGELKDMGSEIRGKDDVIDYDIHTADVPELNLNPEDDLKIK